MTPAPAVSPATVTQYARQLVVKAASGPRVLALRADPQWSGPAAVDVDGATVAVRGCPSYLAVQEALLDRDPGGYLIVLTDRDAADLGESVTSRFLHQRIEMVDPMRTVAALFSAGSVAGDVKTLGPDLVEVLTSHRPTTGYPAATTGAVTRDLALDALLAAVMRVESTDTSALIAVSGDFDARGRWQQLPPSIREAILTWSRDGLGLAGQMVLRVMSSSIGVDAAAVGLAADVLYRTGAPGGALKAQGRLEQHLDGYQPEHLEARALANASLESLRALPSGAVERRRLQMRTEQLLADVGWSQGAEESEVLPAGYAARERQLATALLDDSARDVGPALSALQTHIEAEQSKAHLTERWRMAVRLWRWLQTPDPEPTTFCDALARQACEDSWVDMAIADTFVGRDDSTSSAAFGLVTTSAQQRRAHHDRQFATLLAEAVAADRVASEGLVVERVLAEVVAPICENHPLLFLVLDGMSTGVAAELAIDLTRQGWSELVVDGARTPVIAALPTLTRYSRTALFTGSLRDGGQTDEKSGFARRLDGASLFHKDALRSPAGEELPGAVRNAISSTAPADRVVGVVLNTVDDALAKADPGGTNWRVEEIQHLPALVEAATRAGRIIILTSDHGHVVERGSIARPTAGAEARFRPADSAPTDGEVLLAGPRVSSPGSRIIAASLEDLRYGNKAAGYHGGASAAEVTIPLLVFAQNPDSLVDLGWLPAPPQHPHWWVDDLPTSAATPRPPVQQRITVRAVPNTGPSQATLFPADEVPAAAKTPAKGALLARQVTTSPVYAARRERTYRARLDDATVESVLAMLIDHGGRTHRDVLAQAAGIPSARMIGAFSAMQRLVNIEGYPVISTDADQVTIVLNVALLREQFELAP